MVVGSLAAACAPMYLPGGRLPTADPLRLDSATRPTATLRLSSPQFLESVERVTRESGLFRSFAVDPEGTTTPSTDYTIFIDVSASAKPPTGGEIAYNIAAAATLGVLPMTPWAKTWRPRTPSRRG